MAPAHHPGAGPVRLRRRWRGMLLSLSAFFAVAFFLLYSEAALRWGVYLVADVLVKPLAVGEVQGRLAGPFSLAGIEYKDAELQLSLEKLTVDWKPSRLFAATAHVTEIRATGLSFVQQQSEAETQAEKGAITLPQIGFPLKLIVADATVEQITLKLPAQTESLVITQLALKAETSLNTLQLHTLSLDSDWLRLGINGSIRPRQDYQIDLALDWTLPQQDASPWHGQGTIRGDIKKLELQQRLVSPFVATLALNARDLLDELTWQGSLDVPQLASSQLPYPISPAFSLGGVLKAQGDIRSLTATSTFAGRVETVGPVEGSLDAAFANQRMHLTRLLLKRQKHPAQIEANGDITLAAPLRYQMQAQWQALSWPLDTPTLESDSGTLNVSGEDRQYQFDGDFKLTGTQVPKSKWRLQGSGDAEAIDISTLEGNILDGTLSGDATLKFVPHLSWQAQLKGKSLNPATRWPQWPGSLTFTAGVSGQLPEEGLEIAVALPSLSGTLRGRKLGGRGEGTWQRGVASLKSLELQLGSARLNAQGQLDKELAFNWQLDASDLADLLPQALGSLKGNGLLSGPLATPRLTLRLDGSSLAISDYRAEQLHADVALDLQQHVPSALMLQVEQLLIPGMPQQSVTLKAEGPLNDHRISLDSRSAKQSLNLGASAGYTEGRWAGTLSRLQIDDESLGQWMLAQAATFSFKAGNMRMEEFCLSQAEANLCTAGHWASDTGLKASLRSALFPLQLLQPYLPQRFGIQGELDGKASLAIAPERPPRLEASLTFGQGQFTLFDPETESEALSLSYTGMELQLDTSAAGALDGEFVLSLSESDRIVFDLQTSLARGWPDKPMRQPLKARLRASLRELAFVSSVIPEVQNLKGLVDVDVSLIGTLRTPRLSGHARVEEGQLDIPRMGLKISDIQLAATGDNTKSMDIAGRAHSGDGDLTLSGQLVPDTKGAWSLELAIAGKDFEVARIPEARMQISPNMTVRIVGREIRLDGKIDIPNARLEPPDISLAVKPSDDVVILSEGEADAEPELWRIHTRVRMTAPDSIRFIGYGFDGRIGGDLLLIDEPGSVSRARGELRVVPGSTYKAFGQKLTTERGRLNFADSPVDNPNLDIRASRTIGDVVAGINVSGTAQKPVLTLYSTPPMDQADILSYITLGHPMNTAGQGEGEALAGAAGTAGLVGGNYLAGYIGKQFGLEEARVEAEPGTQSPWVVVGKYLSPRLYIRYGVGVYEDAYSVIVRYQLTEHWQVQGEGGRNSGADILYTFERP